MIIMADATDFFNHSVNLDSCIPCLSSCWTLAINEGTLESVSCPSVTCVKSRATRDPDSMKGVESLETDPQLVENVVGEDLRVRWEKMKERRKAEIG